jgi:hypothetical protein
MDKAMDYKRLSGTELASLFGATQEELRQGAGDVLENSSLAYRDLSQKQRDQTILEILKVIDSGVLSASGPARHPDWEDGWSENLREFEESGFDPKALLPKYYHKDRPCRLRGGYALGESSSFLYCLSDIYRRWLYKKYFQSCREVHEFGCGTGHNLLVLGELFQGIALYGYDWARSSQRILELVREKLGLNIHGRHFNFFAPTTDYELGPKAGVLTFGALEQVGGRHGPFLEAILRSRPEICVHVEGFNELYNPHDLFDYLALRYHKTRNYLDGFLDALQALEKKGRIEILATQRLQLGNLFDDPYSHVVWRPKQRGEE